MPFTVTESEASRIHGNNERIAVANLKQGTRLQYEITARRAGAEEEVPVGANVAGRAVDLLRTAESTTSGAGGF
jgi:hypothetical protein